MSEILETLEYNVIFNEEIISGAQTAFVDKQFASLLDSRPKFLSNDSNRNRKVLTSIIDELDRCSEFCFSVAFITEGGIAPLLPYFEDLEKRGVPGKILTTDYLAFSDPKALEKLNSFSNIELRMYKTNSGESSVGFHTKGYLFNREDGVCRAIIGSSNLTQTALRSNKEWNLKLISTLHGELIQETLNEFDDLWYHATPLVDYIDTYKKIFEEKKQLVRNQQVVSMEQVKLEPNSMQVAFITKLDGLLEENAKRALLISATGTGKTYASAFAVRHMNPSKMLFLVHREQVLIDAEKSYKNVLGQDANTGILSGTSKDSEADYLFSTIQTMSQSSVLQQFARDYFDVIVIDEVHRAGGNSYLKVLDYFKPNFCLGMSATPERMDGFDIYELFDNNIAYEIRLQQALEQDLLCPFHYFGVTDIEIDGKKITDDKHIDFNMLVSDERIDHLLEKAELYGYSGSRLKGLIFCRSNKEADELANKLVERGYRAKALSGSDSQDARQKAVARLTCDEGSDLYEERLDYIVTVDIFNEGVDIPDVNQIIMMRPTESSIVFVQQLGRGLRKTIDKEYVVVIDFIGNYKNSYLIPLALSGDRSYDKDSMRRDVLEGSRLLPGCSTIHFDKIAKEQIFNAIDNSNPKTVTFLNKRYKALKNKLGHIPSMMEFIEFGEIDPLLFVQSSKKSYYRFLADKEKAWDCPLNDKEQEYIEFLSQNVANGMRLHEIEIIEMLKEGIEVNFDSLINRLPDDCDKTYKSYLSAVRVVGGVFFINEEYDVTLFEEKGDVFVASSELKSLLQSKRFVSALDDVLSVGRYRFETKYQKQNSGLTRYEVYSRRDIARLLNWDNFANGGINVTGYPIENGRDSCPIFVTYKKDESLDPALKYKDKFVNQSFFHWQSMRGDGIDSKRVQKIVGSRENGMRLLLFIKKQDNEVREYYYIGDLEAVKSAESEIFDASGKAHKISNVLFEIDQPVQDDIYDYLIS